MKKSSLFVSRKNYKIVSQKQYQKELKHIIRLIKTNNIDEAKKHLNQFMFYTNGQIVDITKLSKQKLYDLLIEELETMLEDYKEKNHNSKDKQAFIRQLKDQRRNTIKRLESKDLSFEDFEQSDLAPRDYINQKWTKEYKSEKMTERMKKRTLESLEKYLELKLQDTNRKDKSLQISGQHTMFQELVIKIPVSNGVDFTNNELQTIINEQIDKEKSRGNEVFFVRIHNDESSKHCHILIKNNDFKLVENQQQDILNEFKLDYDLERMTQDQLKQIGELEQASDYDISNKSMKQDIYFDLVHNINENITNEERQLNNKIMNKKNKYTNMENREFSYVNLEKIKILKQTKELRLTFMKQRLEEVTLKLKEKSLKFSKRFKPLNVKNSRLKKPQFNSFKKDTDLKIELEKTIKDFEEGVHKEVIESLVPQLTVKGRTDKKKFKDANYLKSIRRRSKKHKSQREITREKVLTVNKEMNVNQPEPEYKYNSPSFIQ